MLKTLKTLKTFYDFLGRYEILNSELTVSKDCSRLLTERIVQLERNTVSNAQHHRRESLEINLVPTSIGDDVLENSVYRALSLTGHKVKPNDFLACHRLKKKDTVIVNFKCRKQKRIILINRKNHRNKLLNLIFLVSSSFWRACVRKTINYLINVDS